MQSGYSSEHMYTSRGYIGSMTLSLFSKYCLRCEGKFLKDSLIFGPKLICSNFKSSRQRRQVGISREINCYVLWHEERLWKWKWKLISRLPSWHRKQRDTNLHSDMLSLTWQPFLNIICVPNVLARSQIVYKGI